MSRSAILTSDYVIASEGTKRSKFRMPSRLCWPWRYWWPASPTDYYSEEFRDERQACRSCQNTLLIACVLAFVIAAMVFLMNDSNAIQTTVVEAKSRYFPMLDQILAQINGTILPEVTTVLADTGSLLNITIVLATSVNQTLLATDLQEVSSFISDEIPKIRTAFAAFGSGV